MNFAQQQINFRRGTGAIPGVFETVYDVTIPEITISGSPAAIAYSDEVWVRVKFPDGFSGTPVNMKTWKNSGQLHPDYKINCGFNAAYIEPASGGAAQSSIATDEIIAKLESAYASGYTGPAWDSSGKFIGYIVFQMEASAAAAAFNSSDKKRPLIITAAFDRGDIAIVEKDYLKGLIKDFAILSSWDMYFIDENGEEQLLGYMENAQGVNEAMDTAELLNGLPESVLHTSVIKVGAEITGKLQTFDPNIQAMIGHYNSSDEGETVRLTQTNTFKEIADYHFILRGFNVGGHLMEFHVPSGQIFRDGESSLGGTDYTTFGVRIKATAEENTGRTHYWDITKTPVQTIKLVLNYSGA